jgi:hypothetical protein
MRSIRYLGFESIPDGGRRFELSITAPSQAPIRVSLEIPGSMFSGTDKITIQEASKICYDKLRFLLESNLIQTSFQERLSVEDIQRWRHFPRGSHARHTGSRQS